MSNNTTVPTIEQLRREISVAFTATWPRLDVAMSLQPFTHTEPWLKQITKHHDYWPRLLWVLARRFAEQSFFRAFCGQDGIIRIGLKDSEETVLLMDAMEAVQLDDVKDEPILFRITEMPQLEREEFATHRLIVPFTQALSARERLYFFGSPSQEKLG